MEKNCNAAEEKADFVKARDPPPDRNESQMEAEPGESSHIEYTELTLDCLDLKAQEELLSAPQSGD